MWATEFWSSSSGAGGPEAVAFCVVELGKGVEGGGGVPRALKSRVAFSGKLAMKIDLVLIFFSYISLSEVLIAKCHTADAN